MKYNELKNKIDIDYPVKQKEYKTYLKNHWKELNQNKSDLEKIVGDEFKGIVKKVNLNGAEILDFKVSYNLKQKNFDLKITELKTPEGIINSDKNIGNTICPHFYLQEVTGFIEGSPKIKEFERKYNILCIQNPNNYCVHK